MVSYADFITLLFAFFVIMYAAAKSDKAKMTAVAHSIKKAFGGMSQIGILSAPGSSGGNTVNPFHDERIPGGRVMDLPGGKMNTAADPDPEIQEIRELLEESIHFDLGSTEVQGLPVFQYDSQGLTLSLTTQDFFDAGSVQVRPDMQPLLEKIGRVLVQANRSIRIQGHLDPGEPLGSFSSPWDFSAARARWVLEYWQGLFGKKWRPERFSVEGFGAHHPLTLQKDPISRARNRRVEILILRNSSQVQKNSSS